jgi:hypothetical protein
MKQSKSVAQKMGIKAETRAFFLNASEAVLETLSLPDLEVAKRLEGKFDYIHLFTKSQDELDEAFPKLKTHLKETGMLWVSWLKGRKEGADLTLPEVIRIGYNHGLVESTTLSVDTVWSGIKFTYPKKGKSYHNSYGQLPNTRK